MTVLIGMRQAEQLLARDRDLLNAAAVLFRRILLTPWCLTHLSVS
jgi:hypothetical protein